MDPCHPYERFRLSFLFLALAWPSHNCCGYSASESEDGRSLPVFLPLRPASHIGVPDKNLVALLPVDSLFMCLGKEWNVGPHAGILAVYVPCHTWDTWMEFLVCGCSLTQPWLLWPFEESIKWPVFPSLSRFFKWMNEYINNSSWRSKQGEKIVEIRKSRWTIEEKKCRGVKWVDKVLKKILNGQCLFKFEIFRLTITFFCYSWLSMWIF